jgi:hypothetical protein
VTVPCHRTAHLEAAIQVLVQGRTAGGDSVVATTNAGSHRGYSRWRAHQIAYGRWQPWADAAPVREHVGQLRRAGGSYQAIAQVAGVATMTVYRLQHAEPTRNRPAPARIRTQHAERLLAVTVADVQDAAARRDAIGARRRLRALIAMGHPAVSLAGYLGVPPRTVWDLVRGRTVTVTRGTHAAIRDLYEQMWDLRPPERTAAQRRSAAAARTRAARNGWPTPMGLDDDQIDDPAYWPRAHWHPATGTGVAEPATPSTGKADLRPSDRRRHLAQDQDLRAVL